MTQRHFVRWALFFNRFNFTVTCHPGHKNYKANALSSLHHPEPVSSPPVSILPPAIVSPIKWTLDDQIAQYTCSECVLPGGPEGPSTHLFGLRQPATISLLRNHYWWPTMTQDVSRYARGCSVCSITKTPQRLLEGKLVPLPVPQQPWSHVETDFMMDLPSSEFNTCVVLVVDRISKACKLIPLPTALEVTEPLFHHVFHHFGLLKGIVPNSILKFGCWVLCEPVIWTPTAN